MSLSAARLSKFEAAVLPGTPSFVIEAYSTLEERARHRSFGLIEDDVVVLDTETTGLSVRDNKLIEISAARLRGREVVERFDTFVNPGMLIPREITALTSITNADVARCSASVSRRWPPWRNSSRARPLLPITPCSTARLSRP